MSMDSRRVSDPKYLQWISQAITKIVRGKQLPSSERISKMLQLGLGVTKDRVLAEIQLCVENGSILRKVRQNKVSYRIPETASVGTPAASPQNERPSSSTARPVPVFQNEDSDGDIPCGSQMVRDVVEKHFDGKQKMGTPMRNTTLCEYFWHDHSKTTAVDTPTTSTQCSGNSDKDHFCRVCPTPHTRSLGDWPMLHPKKARGSSGKTMDRQKHKKKKAKKDKSKCQKKTKDPRREEEQEEPTDPSNIDDQEKNNSLKRKATCDRSTIDGIINSAGRETPDLSNMDDQKNSPEREANDLSMEMDTPKRKTKKQKQRRRRRQTKKQKKQWAEAQCQEEGVSEEETTHPSNIDSQEKRNSKKRRVTFDLSSMDDQKERSTIDGQKQKKKQPQKRTDSQWMVTNPGF